MIEGQLVYRKRLVTVVERTACLTKIYLAENNQPWVPNEQLETAKQKAERVLVGKPTTKIAYRRAVVPAQFMEYVIANYGTVEVHVRPDLTNSFEENWTRATGNLCCEVYTLDQNKWGMASYVTLPTPPASMLLGGVDVLPDERRPGWSKICKNDFFWEFISFVKALGPRISLDKVS